MRYALEYSDPFNRLVQLPFCEVWVLGRTRRVLVLTMVDSGAERPVFHKTTAEDAGIDLSRAAQFPIQYGGSRTDGWIAPVRIQLGSDGPKFDTEVVFVERLAYPYGLLGLYGVFNKFNEVAFLQRVKPRRVEFR
jgi:hypothetical protein